MANQKDVAGQLPPNTFFVEVSGAGLPEVDGLFVPSTAPATKSESGTLSSLGYWNGRMAWDRADGLSDRSPALSYSNTYKSWRICRRDGHLAYEITCQDPMPPTDRPWNVYKMGMPPAPRVVIHDHDPRLNDARHTPADQKDLTPHIIFVLGGPGAGKGTMCELAQIQLGWTHLSTGELLREELESDHPSTAAMKNDIAAGKLVCDELVVSLLKSAMESVTRTTGKTNFLLDGFPRSLSNLDAWFSVFGKESELPKMMFFECPFPVLQKRILARAQHTGRSDDNLESLKQRFDTFKRETLPVAEYFKSKNKCVEVNTSHDRVTVYELVRDQLAIHTDPALMDQPLTEQSQMLLGLRPFPQDQ